MSKFTKKEYAILNALKKPILIYKPKNPPKNVPFFIQDIEFIKENKNKIPFLFYHTIHKNFYIVYKPHNIIITDKIAHYSDSFEDICLDSKIFDYNDYKNPHRKKLYDKTKKITLFM